MNIFAPEHSGVFHLNHVPEDFTERMARRVHDGLFIPGSRVRANYSVRSRGGDVLHFGSDSVWTSINLGLNEVTLRRTGPATVEFRFTYWTWLLYGVALCGFIGLFLLVGFAALPAMRQAVNAQPLTTCFFWGMTIFWGLLWPWILVLLHKRPAARALERIVGEVCCPEAARAHVIPGPGGPTSAVRRYRSKATLLGVPLVDIAWGMDENRKLAVAKGVIAVGNVAIGGIALGNFTLGLVSVGSVALGGLAVGGVAVGICALAGLAIGGIAVGGLAIGLFAVGGLSLGLWALGTLGGGLP